MEPTQVISGLSPAREISFKHRVMQMIFGQIEVCVNNVDLVVKSSSDSMEETNRKNNESILKRADKTSPKNQFAIGILT